MSKEFTRGARYVVLKNADIMQCLTVNELIQLRYIQARVGEHRAKLGKPQLDCVVVESDWPEYEPTWNAIEMRMTGSLKESAVQIATRIMNIELIRERDDLRIALRHEADCVEAAAAKIEALGAKIAEIGAAGVWFQRKVHPAAPAGGSNRFPLYALPGAKGEWK